MTSSNRLIRKQNQAESYAKANFVFSTNTPAGWTLSTELAKLGIKRKAKITITINPGVTVGFLNVNSAPDKSKVLITNLGSIIGAPNSGTALSVGLPAKVDNRGTIAGGGGAGGKGGDCQHGGKIGYVCQTTIYPGAAGGQGAGLVGTSISPATAGGYGTPATDAASKPGDGGDGGGLGQPGQAGDPGIRGNSWQGGMIPGPDGVDTYYPACGPYNGGVWQVGQPGGPAGVSVAGSSRVTWLNKGTLLGPLA